MQWFHAKEIGPGVVSCLYVGVQGRKDEAIVVVKSKT